ncbi:SDR family NAD(P)-dependent oxidoreductase [Rhizobium lusitanum]|uniref:SDR family NAD(P)-dependent oxidoreductase n=1 Tax=Rhizobium lusitanum TaxID=293958 RepID=A0A6L9UDS4_9HYPH|nr:SDR family NAD(P)-dependent oxidoreductase [Rhizobium lusitanum]
MTQTVFITGAARGIGEACVRQFLAAGWNVYATARDPEKIDVAANEKLAMGRLDVGDDASILAAVSDAVSRFGAIDLLVNNAGVGLGGPVEAMTREELHALLDVNLVGAALVTKAVLPGMRENRRGMIINIGSLAGAAGLPFLAPYCASKFALAGLSEAMQYELAPFGIRVKLIELTGSRTQFKQQILRHPAYASGLDAVEMRLKKGMSSASPPDLIAREIVHIAGSPSKRIRYALGAGKRMFGVMQALPEWMFRSMLSRAFGL